MRGDDGQRGDVERAGGLREENKCKHSTARELPEASVFSVCVDVLLKKRLRVVKLSFEPVSFN